MFPHVPARMLTAGRRGMQVRLEGGNPYMLLALLTVTRDPSKQQRGAPRHPAMHGRRMNAHHLQPQITTASSFLRMHLPGYVIQSLQKLAPAVATSDGASTLPEGEEAADSNLKQEGLAESPLLAALIQADGALRTLTHNTHPPASSTRSTAGRSPHQQPADTPCSQQPPASNLFVAVAKSTAMGTSSSVFGDSAGSVVLVDVSRQRAHSVSWGDTHGAHLTNALGHALEAHVCQEHRVHGVSVRTASYGGMHGAHNIVLGSSGLWCAHSLGTLWVIHSVEPRR